MSQIVRNPSRALLSLIFENFMDSDMKLANSVSRAYPWFFGVLCCAFSGLGLLLAAPSVQAAPEVYQRVTIESSIARSPISQREVESTSESAVTLDTAALTLALDTVNRFRAERLLTLTDASEVGSFFATATNAAESNCPGSPPCVEALSVTNGYLTLADASDLFRPKGVLSPLDEFFVTVSTEPGRAENADSRVSLQAMVARPDSLVLADLAGSYRLAVYTQELERDVAGDSKEAVSASNISLAFNGDGTCSGASLGNGTVSQFTQWPGVGARSGVFAFLEEGTDFTDCSYTVDPAAGSAAVALDVFDGGDTFTLNLTLFVSSEYRYLIGRRIDESDEGVSVGAESSIMLGVRSGAAALTNADLAGVYFLSRISETLAGSENSGTDMDSVTRAGLNFSGSSPDAEGFSGCEVLGVNAGATARFLGGDVPVAAPATVVYLSEPGGLPSECRYRVDSPAQVTLELTTVDGPTEEQLAISDDRQTLVGATLHTSEDPLEVGIDLELLLPGFARVEALVLQRFAGGVAGDEVADFIAPLVPANDPNVAVVASVLPGSRSVQTNEDATAFATIINAGTAGALGCDIRYSGPLALSLSYQQTDPATNAPVGLPDEGINIPPGAAQTFVFRVRPLEEFSAQEIALEFSCLNSGAALSVAGLNTLLLSSTASAGPDLVALGATVLNDGIAHLDATSRTGFFSVASFNVGSGDDMSVSVDTGSASLPLAATICETNPASGACVNPGTPTAGPVALTIGEAGTPTFSVFLSATQDIALDPAGSRVFVRFRDSSGVVRGATSVAVQTD